MLHCSYEGYKVPKNATINIKRSVINELKDQLLQNPALVPKSNWIFVQLPLCSAHRYIMLL